jgi:hypothetical protein
MERYWAHMGLAIFDQMIVTRRSRDYMIVTARQAGEAFVKYIQEQMQG